MYLIYLFRCTLLIILILEPWSESLDYLHIFKNESSDYLETRYGYFPEHVRLEMLDKAKEMFSFAYSNYIHLAFPNDELNPINCCGRGPDHDDRSNININDVLGDYSLTLVDSLDTLAIIGNVTQFQQALSLLINHVNFDKDNVVQVFEVNIRLIGALLSTHLLMKDESEPFGKLAPEWYEDQLLHLAHDLATRLIPAFENSSTGLPLPRVNLRHGVPAEPLTSETCPAGAGSLLLEMGILSRLLDDPVYEGYARRANRALWNYRAKNTGLLGNVIDAESGEWIGRLSGLGAGLDSFYEYLLKSYIMFGETEDYQMFNDIYKSINEHMRRGRPHCNHGVGDHPLFVNVDMNTGLIHTTWIDSLQAAFAGVQVLNGDIEEAICTHALYYLLWKRFGVLPERWNWKSMATDVAFYPLRPELIESTYLLYQATKSPFYLHVGQEILENLNKFTRTHCGYATVHSVWDMSLEDRMESFFLSETAKYLFLLFDRDNYINQNFHKYIFSTEGHIFPVDKMFREKSWPSDSTNNVPLSFYNISEPICESVEQDQRFFLPLKSKYIVQVGSVLGIDEY